MFQDIKKASLQWFLSLIVIYGALTIVRAILSAVDIVLVPNLGTLLIASVLAVVYTLYLNYTGKDNSRVLHEAKNHGNALVRKLLSFVRKHFNR